MSKLLPFDPDAKCPKCGNTEVETDHVEKGTGSRYAPCVECRKYERAEHLDRRCSRCGYTWPEATVDAGGDGQE